MSSFKCVEECKAWQSSRELVGGNLQSHIYRGIYRDFGLRDQVRRAAVSVASNIAEGFERGGNKEFIQFLFQAKGSCCEVRTQLYLAWDLDYLTEDKFNRLREMTVKTSEVIWGLIRYLKQSSIPGHKYKD